MDVLSGQGCTVNATFVVDGTPFIPDAGSVYWTLRGNDGNTVLPYVDVAISVPTASTSVKVSIPSSVNNLAGGRRVENRTVVVVATRNGSAWLGRFPYRVTTWFNTQATADQVRACLGVEAHELPDSNVDLVKAYFFVEAKIGSSTLTSALASGDLTTIQVNDLLVRVAALQALPSLALKLAESETDGAHAFKRLASVDLEKVRARLEAEIGDLLEVMAPATDATPVIFMLSTQADPITNA